MKMKLLKAFEQPNLKLITKKNKINNIINFPHEWQGRRIICNIFTIHFCNIFTIHFHCQLDNSTTIMCKTCQEIDTSRDHEHPIESLSESPRTSRQYGAEGLKTAPIISRGTTLSKAIWRKLKPSSIV